MTLFRKTLVAAALLLVLPLPAEASLFHCNKCPPPPPIPVVLDVCHPCTGCVYHVPVCVPACCCGAPCATCKKTLCGYGKVVFTWECGHSVTVRFPKCGGYKVSSW